jgi:hypothetical protein
MALAMVRYFSVQSVPRRVRICALQARAERAFDTNRALVRAANRGPSGAFSTSLASCGLIQAGGGLTAR